MPLPVSVSRILKFISNNKLPCYVLLFYLLAQAILLFAYPQSSRPSTVIAWDTFGYYLYLPAIFIYRDLFHLAFADPIMHQYALSSYFYQAHMGPLNNYVMNYPLGMSIMYFPFFCCGHIAAKVLGYAADGFSAPYQYSIFIGGIFYAITGIIVTIRNLRFFFSEKLTALLVLILLGATNYFYYTSIENAMTHSYLFTIAAFIIYFSIKWQQSPKAQYALIIGVLSGLAVVIRPTEILWCLIPLLWQVKDIASLQQKFALVKQHLLHIFLFILGACMVGFMQMAYWKMASGKFVFYSYENIGFDFLHPHIIHGLFSIRKGWLVYTPVMAVALFGIPLLWWKKRELFFACLLYTVATIYITFAWQIWWYGGSFGQRSMVESYALLLFPMGFFIKTVASRLVARWAIFAFIASCIFLNLFQTWQYLHGFWSTEGPTNYVYKLTFLKTHRNRKAIRHYFKLEEHAGSIIDSSLVYATDFENGKWQHAISDNMDRANHVLKIDHAAHSEILLDSNINANGNSYLRINCRAMFEPYEYDDKKFGKVVVTIQSADGPPLKQSILPLQPLIGNFKIVKESDVLGVPGIWDSVYTYISLPAAGPLKLRVELINDGYNNVYFVDFKIWLLK